MLGVVYCSRLAFKENKKQTNIYNNKLMGSYLKSTIALVIKICSTRYVLAKTSYIPLRDINALFVFSIWLTRNIDKAHLRRIIFDMFLCNLRVKSKIKIIAQHSKHCFARDNYTTYL